MRKKITEMSNTGKEVQQNHKNLEANWPTFQRECIKGSKLPHPDISLGHQGHVITPPVIWVTL